MLLVDGLDTLFKTPEQRKLMMPELLKAGQVIARVRGDPLTDCPGDALGTQWVYALDAPTSQYGTRPLAVGFRVSVAVVPPFAVAVAGMFS